MIKLIPRGAQLDRFLGQKLKARVGVVHPHLMGLRSCFVTGVHLALVLEHAHDSLYSYAVYACAPGLQGPGWAACLSGRPVLGAEAAQCWQELWGVSAGLLLMVLEPRPCLPLSVPCRNAAGGPLLVLLELCWAMHAGPMAAWPATAVGGMMGDWSRQRVAAGPGRAVSCHPSASCMPATVSMDMHSTRQAAHTTSLARHSQMCRERGAFPEHEARSYFQQLVLALDYSLSKGATDRCGPLRLGTLARAQGPVLASNPPMVTPAEQPACLQEGEAGEPAAGQALLPGQVVRPGAEAPGRGGRPGGRLPGLVPSRPAQLPACAPLPWICGRMQA